MRMGLLGTVSSSSNDKLSMPNLDFSVISAFREFIKLVTWKFLVACVRSPLIKLVTSLESGERALTKIMFDGKSVASSSVQSSIVNGDESLISSCLGSVESFSSCRVSSSDWLLDVSCEDGTGNALGGNSGKEPFEGRIDMYLNNTCSTLSSIKMQ